MIHRLIYTSIGPVVGRALVIVDLRVAAYICGGVFSVCAHVVSHLCNNRK